MKSVMKSILGVQMTVMFLAAALAGPAAAQPVPFKGSLQLIEIVHVQGNTLISEGSGTGTATHLGRFTVTRHAVVDLDTFVPVGSAHFIAANGDGVITELVGEPPGDTGDPNVLLIKETYTITGGTGRFAGATGSFEVQRLFYLNTGFTSGSFDGTIVIH